MQYIPGLSAEQLCSHQAGLQLVGRRLLGGVRGTGLHWDRWSREADLYITRDREGEFVFVLVCEAAQG